MGRRCGSWSREVSERMPIEMTTRVVFRPGESPWPLMVIDQVFVPRGSGNRNKARRLAESWRQSVLMAPFVEKVTVGASKVRVHLTMSPALKKAMDQYQREQAEQIPDVPGQELLFG